MKSWLAVAALALAVPVAALAADAPKSGGADQQAMMEKMLKAGTPGPQHDMLKKMAGEWTAVIKSQMDPSAPATTEQATMTVTNLMDGRFSQEVASGSMMGAPFSGMGITGYDNVLGKFVSIWIDNMGTGIMKSEGTADASGKVITWNGVMSDPLTGKPSRARMITTITDDDHHTFEMFAVPPGGKKEMKMMTIEYTRK